MNPVLLLITFLSLIIRFAPAQNNTGQLVYSNKQLNYLIVKYDDIQKKESIFSNYLIKEISNSIPKILKYTSFQFQYYEEIYITDKGKGNYELQLKFTQPEISGDIYYKEVYAGDVLYPKILDYVMQVFYQDKMLKEIIIHSDTIPYEATYEFSYNPKDKPDKSLFKVSAVTKRLDYDEESKEKFKVRVQWIDEYYSLNTSLNMLHDKLNSIDFTFVDMIPVYKFQLDDIENQISAIKNLNLAVKLNLDKSDPILFIQRIDEMSIKTAQLKTVAEQYLESMDFWYFRTGMEHLTKKDTAKAIKFFTRSIDMNPDFPQSHYQLARIDLTRGKLIEATGRVQMMLERMEENADYIELFYELDNVLFRKMIDSGIILMDSYLYQEALFVFYQADSLCLHKKHIQCPDELYLHIAKAKQGVYQSYLLIANRAIDNDRLDLALLYIDVAIDYQHKSSTEIPSNRPAEDLLQGIVNTYAGRGYRALNSKSYSDAWNFFNTCLKICSKYPQLKCSDDISKGMNIAEEQIGNRNQY